jgi:chemotaxis signal transduction protein
MSMKTVVNFRTGGRRYCIPVEATLGVRKADGLVALPAPRDGVVGILAAQEPITVLSLLGSASGQVLVCAANGRTFGLLVEEVTGLSRIADGDIGAAPVGQDEALVCGTINHSDGVVFVADPTALAARL